MAELVNGNLQLCNFYFYPLELDGISLFLNLSPHHFIPSPRTLRALDPLIFFEAIRNILIQVADPSAATGPLLLLCPLPGRLSPFFQPTLLILTLPSLSAQSFSWESPPQPL